MGTVNLEKQYHKELLIVLSMTEREPDTHLSLMMERERDRKRKINLNHLIGVAEG